MAVDMSEARKLLENVESIVTSKFDRVSDLADQSWNTAVEYITDLDHEIANFEFDPIDITEWHIEPIPTEEYGPVPPEDIDDVIIMPVTPIADELEDASIAGVDVPTLGISDPVIVIPVPPTPDWPEDPGDAPTVDEEIEIATKPPFELPGIPQLSDLQTSDPPSTPMPTFTAVEPEFDVDLPQSIFVYEEIPYTSDLLEATQSKILDLVVNGGTGLGAEIEDAIWNRALSRKQIADAAKHDEAERYWSTRGFNIPPGALTARLDELLTERARAEDEINETIMIEQAKLAQTNTHFAMTTAIQCESSIMAYIGSVAQRALDSAKYAQEFAIALFNAAIARYNSRINAYQIAAAVYESKIRATMLILEKYKLELESVRLRGEIQKISVELYKNRVAALAVLMDLYKTELESSKIKAEIQRLILEGYKTKVEAFTAKMGGIIAEYNAYQAQIGGEKAKADVYAKQVDAFLGKVQGEKVRSDVQIAESNVILAKNGEKMNKFRVELERYAKESEVLIRELETRGKVYGYDIAAYEADTKLAGTRLMADIESYKARAARSHDVVTQRLSEARINLEELTKVHNVQVEAMRAGAQVSAQMAASALSSVAAGAQISFRGAFEESKSEHEQTNIG